VITRTKNQIWNWRGDLELHWKPQFQLNWSSIKEANGDIALVPRFSLKQSEIFPDIPTNTNLKPTEDIILKAIQWGMILEIDYKGEEDDSFSGHNRAIYPMVYGFSQQGKPLIRGFHLNGWSVSEGGKTEKVWRMFRFDRILNIVFSGAFFRIAPEGYNALDKGIYDRVAMADLDDIRNLQQRLVNKSLVDTIDNLNLKGVKEVNAKDMLFSVQLDNLYQGGVLQKKDAKNIRICVCKPLNPKSEWIFLVGVHIKKGQVFKLKTDKKFTGTYTAFANYMLNELETRFKSAELYKQKEFKLVLYVDAN